LALYFAMPRRCQRAFNALIMRPRFPPLLPTGSPRFRHPLCSSRYNGCHRRHAHPSAYHPLVPHYLDASPACNTTRLFLFGAVARCQHTVYLLPLVSLTHAASLRRLPAHLPDIYHALLTYRCCRATRYHHPPFHHTAALPPHAPFHHAPAPTARLITHWPLLPRGAANHAFQRAWFATAPVGASRTVSLSIYVFRSLTTMVPWNFL